MIRLIDQLLNILGDIKAASRGPSALGKHLVRKAAHRQLARVLRRL